MGEDIREKVIEVLKTVVDPELSIDVYNLGLVYGVRIEDRRIEVELGLTSPFCPLAHILPLQVKRRLEESFPGYTVEVKLNLEKPWSPEMMTEEGRRRFKELFGYDPVEAWR